MIEILKKKIKKSETFVEILDARNLDENENTSV